MNPAIDIHGGKVRPGLVWTESVILQVGTAPGTAARLQPWPIHLRECVDVIVSNLPFLPPGLAASHSGSGADGLQLVRELAVTAREFLRPDGWLVLQIAACQWYGFAQALADLGYEELSVRRRGGDAPTEVMARWPGWCL